MPELQKVNSIIRGINILKILSNGMDRISDISKELKLSKASVHRLLKTLEFSDFVKQDPITRRYYLGPLIHYLASKYEITHKNFILSAFDEMVRLRDISRETVALHIRLGIERICLEEIQGLEIIKYSSGKGTFAPIYLGSAGKVLLAELEYRELQLIMENIQLTPVGPNTITNKETFLNELEKVRTQGYATSFGERLPGGSAISVPIKKYVCPVALSVLGPENRLTIRKMMRILKELKKSSTRISRKLIETSERTKYKIG